MTQKQQEYRFSPRPEAHAMRWENLLRPVQYAVHDLLLRIAGAEEVRRAGHGARPARQREVVSNCFLVYGSRGTGKTTVLLSAKEAVERAESDQGFFHAEGEPREDLELSAQHRARELKAQQHTVWLDPLDLEPLPLSTNLLTTLLTRVRNALDAGGNDRDRARSTSIFEESATDARQQLGDLINDATLMWEEIQESDTRNRANRQRAAADIYSSFRARFTQAMDALSKKLDLRHGHDQGCSIILAIDNIDRTPEHLKAIVKLAQLVSHPCLWLVMAGDRVELEGFLERAYWKELIHSREGADARGKAGQFGEDEALGMARRQAHAAAQKVWPPSHRIEVNLVRPEETLTFSPPDAGTGNTIRDLLAKVSVECFIADVKDPAEKYQFSFIDLFEIQHARPRDAKPWDLLSVAARNGLCLPARGVLDLWQLAHWVVNGGAETLGAVKIARTMLRNAAADSTMPSTMGQYLQAEIIHRDTQGGTLLDFEEVALLVGGQLSVASTVCMAEEPIEIAELAILSSLHVSRSVDMLLNLSLGGKDTPPVPLPELAAAWLMILYDVLVYVPKLAVLGTTTIDVHLIQVTHDVVMSVNGGWQRQQARVSWPVPDFYTFNAHDVLWRHWENFYADPPARCACSECKGSSCAMLLVQGWIWCALQTFEVTSPRRDATATGPHAGASLERVFDDASLLYQEIKSEGQRALSQRKYFDSTGMCDWLETKMPLLLTRLYAPVGGTVGSSGIGSPACLTNQVQWIKANKHTELVTHWRKNRLFLWAHLDAQLASMVVDWIDLPVGARSSMQDWAYGDLRQALE